MKLKIASYNVSGGFYNDEDKTEYLDKESAINVDDRLLKQIIETINNENIDIICFQEIITTKRIKYIDTIIENTNMKYYDEFELSECNIVKDTDFGLTILSKYPITNTIKNFFPNPNLTKTTESGNTYYLYDKGYMMCNIDINGKSIRVLNHHGFPFRRFNSSPEENPDVFNYFENAIDKYKPDIITGDFNADNFMELMPKVNDNYTRTINDITTTDGKKFDDILIHKDREYKSNIMKLLSDHYLVITNISF